MKHKAQTDIYERYKTGEPSNYDTWGEEWLHFRMPRTIEDTDPWKLKHNMIAPFKRTDPITPSQKSFIRRILYYPAKGDIPHCKHKLTSFVKKCEERGDFSHSSKNHICRECRCKRPAGFGTKGDFYGIGENTGHWGCGLCMVHERTIPRHHALAIAAWDMWTIRYYGDHMVNTKDYEDAVSAEAKNASIRTAVRKELLVVHDNLIALTENLIPKDTKNVVDALENLTDAIKASQFVDGEQAEEILAILNSKILERTKLTEYQKGELVPLSTKTEIELKNSSAMSASRIKVNDFKLDSANYIHYDELAKRLDMHLSIEKRSLEILREKLANSKEGDPDPIETVYRWSVKEIKDVWDNTKTGANH